ncbi:MAG: small subunit ribosomal protein S5 [Parcubacteria group bacterium Gr01-1014_38]|nr:MAG: small subunit ribosomal protein S5 [Parcubacteria group bacterium Gr01-1014_38]
MALRTFEVSGESALDHAVVDLRRVSRTVKGGRRFRFRAAVVVGDKKGQVGFALQKGKDAQSAIQKAQTAARKHLRSVLRRGSTIPHAVKARYRGAEVLLKPAPSGTGIIAGGPLRSLASLAGIQDLSSKLLGSRNKVNVVRAALLAFEILKPAEEEQAAVLTRPTEESGGEGPGTAGSAPSQ